MQLRPKCMLRLIMPPPLEINYLKKCRLRSNTRQKTTNSTLLSYDYDLLLMTRYSYFCAISPLVLLIPDRYKAFASGSCYTTGLTLGRVLTCSEM
ncbi:hypothetical protein TNIN_385181 [Trichonephila inaurata madagascariensis]|uniref:Uncharacterized protein n=1 Tax=Trichonephila inaurata madagascariensis TaxID=2747483 RepID=A0A8X7BTK2_9ARAC|nr:hypothetical protein TNIN_385181 [Trichonephila inaurata madagascariensis]